VLTALSPDAVPPNRDLQLWLLPPNAQRPQSLGLLPASGRTVSLPGPQAVGAQLLISLEPQGGSPTNLPTGPVLYGGALNRT
jgi:anti-sigma-K factor RskA